MKNEKTIKLEKEFTTTDSNEILSTEKDQDIFFNSISKEIPANNELKSALKTYNKLTQ